MDCDWQMCRLREIADVIDSRHKTPTYAEVGFPMVRVVDVKGGALSLIGTKKVKAEVYREFSKGRDPKVGDLVITRVGSYGNVSYVSSNDKFCLGQNTALIVSNHADRYLYYVLTSPLLKMQIEQAVVGAVQKTISLESIKNLSIPMPSVHIRKKISTLLSSIDDKITINTQINQTLEQMAQALFKSWFVDFDPVIDNALDAGNPIPEPLAERASRRKAMWAVESEKALARLPAETRRLFPDRFEEDDVLGWVPVVWNSGCISDVCKINAKSWTAKNRPPSVNYVDLANTKAGVIEETTWFDFAEAPSRARRVLSPGDTIIGTVRPGNRSYALVGGAKDQLTGSTGFAVLTPNSKELVEFVYLAVTREEVIEEFAHLADGGAYPAIKPSVVGDAKVVIPSKEILFLFNKFLTPMFIKYQDNLRENCTLKNLRDTLLPKLLSGELKLPEAEAAVDTALETEFA